jgi:DeoR/GlpR family transcriptional regulator of sugar metabolism
MISRHQQILETLAAQQNATVNELSRLLKVSEVTIRADLSQLATEGKVIRERGGARLAEERIRQEYTYQTRKSLNADKKRKIGQLAATLIKPMESILLDSSTTAVAVAQALKDNEQLKDITVVPTGIWTAIELMCCPAINVLLAGGYLRHTTGSIAGLPANDLLKNFNIQKAFLGAWGISIENGLTDTHLLEVELKRFIVQHVQEVIIVVDGSKFNQSALAAYANIEQITRVITDDSAPKEVMDKMSSRGVEILVAS